jgi:uncharacterized protein DUF6969
MQAAAATIKCIRSVLAGRAGGILSAVAPDPAPLAEWRHYPPGEVYDPETHAQYFYHAHPPSQRSPREHGHFHSFLRAEGMPAGVAPLILPETAVADAARASPQAPPLNHGRRDEVSHLVAIALDPVGEPIRVFTTNRWVTGETWYRADDVINMLDCFKFCAAGGPALLNDWIGAIVTLFRPQIAWLLRQRDETVTGWRQRRRTNVFEDTRLEVTSSFDIDLDAQFSFLDQLQAGADAGCAARSARLPRMTEGWGEGNAG